MKKKMMSNFLMCLLILGSVAPFVDADMLGNSASGSYDNPTNSWQASNPTLDGFYKGSVDTYWPILNNLENDECSAANSDFIVAIPPMGCSPTVVRSDLLAEQNVPVFCQLTAIKVNPLIDVSTIKSISFKGDYPEEVAGISFHPARAAVASSKTLMGSPIEENIGYVVIVLKKQPKEANLEKYVSGMLTASVKYDAQTTFGTGAGEYYLEPMSEAEWDKAAPYSSFWGGKGYLRTTRIEENSAVIEVMSSKDEVLESVTLTEGETSESIYYPDQYCTASLQVKLNKIDNSEDMVRLDIDGDSIWARRGTKFFDGKCVVGKITIGDNNDGEVIISCSGGKSFKLWITSVGTTFSYGDKTYTVIGENEIARSDEWFYEKIEDDWKWYSPEGNEGIVDAVDEAKFYELADNAIFSGSGNTILGGKYSKETFVPKYVDLAEETTMELLNEFPFEMKDNDEHWGEDSLYQQIKIAEKIEDREAQIKLIDLFLETYPESVNTEDLRDKKIRLNTYTVKGSSENIAINNNNYNLRVEGFVKGSGANDNVNVRFNGGSLISMKRGKVYDSNGEEITVTNIPPRMTVTSISSAGARFNYVWVDENDKTVSKNFAVGNGEFYSVGGLEVYVVDTNIREVAYVSLIPKINNRKTEANFTFNIGIEKRAVELTPEKANEKIKELNKSIAEWESRIENLGKLVKGMKRACFITSTALNLKAMFSGKGGESLARGEVMDIFEEKCRGEGASSSAELQKCYSKYSEDIDGSMKEYADAMEAVNERVKCAKTEETVESGFFDSKVINNKKYVDELARCTGLPDSWSYVVGGVEVTKGHLTDVRDYQAVLLYEEVCNGGESSACKIAENNTIRALSDNVDRIKATTAADAIGVESENIYTDSEGTQKVSVDMVTEEKKTFGEYRELKKGDYYKGISSDNSVYLYVLNKTTVGSFRVNEIYRDGRLVEKDAKDSKDKNLFTKYTFISTATGSSCTTTMISEYVRYYETANQQGFVAVVPFDIKKGWYAYVESQDYSESGEANVFEVCNVGSDGIISEGSKGGDICVQFRTSAGSNVPFTPCPKYSDSQVNAIYLKAMDAIREANRNGNGIEVDGKFIGKAPPMGTDGTDLECTDFMSIEDCNLMFNVCDPVICPSSRCDMGGKFPVADVISTGVIGSVALCLPNFGTPSEGGVIIPVCLTGIHAGLDSYVSILKSYKSCLEQNVESGEYVGICDEIRGIYLCEFFWGQISPLMDNLLPNIVSGIGGEPQTRGGAEYLTTQAAFDNAEKSVDYFTKTYAKNSFDSFGLQSTEEVGTTICKGFVGSSFPTVADMLDDLTEPESPSQFYAYFSESAFTDATVPSTSQYKVYYHIYAGREEGVQYKVYLKNPPQSSYYASRPTVLVDSGFSGPGSAADKTKDFTAPSGYKELCVSINGREECGFGKVTSNFGLNYASQKYISDQAQTTSITKTEDCVTTSASAWGAVSPNLQSGVETALGGDDIATTGISRICASANPEQGIVGGNDIYCDMENNEDGENMNCAVGYFCVAIGGEIKTDFGVCENDVGNRQISKGKWVDVGFCDIENVRCWLDSTTVEENLGLYSAVNDIDFVDDLMRNSGRLEELNENYQNVRDKLNTLQDKIGKLDKELRVDAEGEVSEAVAIIVVGLDEVSGAGDNIGQGLNVDKAEALALKAELYRMVAREMMIGALEIKIVVTKMTEKEVETALGEGGGTIIETIPSETSESEYGVNRLRGVDSVEDLIEERDFNWDTNHNMRTDRHNNPTAFIVELSEQANLELGVEYEQGDSFSGIGGETYYTARLIGDSIGMTIKVIDRVGFYTRSGQQRWTHTAMNKSDWDSLDDCKKANVIEVMYYREGGDGSIFENYGDKYICGEESIVDKVFIEDIEEGDVLQDKDGNNYEAGEPIMSLLGYVKINLLSLKEDVRNVPIRAKPDSEIVNYGRYEFKVVG
ncbi:hypothetical protein KAS08_05535 [Candidatus Pacearchaeota archaeon]|nr:hypothetical protein [Candidatus Pacearchaeota archaeon]